MGTRQSTSRSDLQLKKPRRSSIQLSGTYGNCDETSRGIIKGEIKPLDPILFAEMKRQPVMMKGWLRTFGTTFVIL
uniref:Ovule protein n=1 Tax=Caenorhabditis tropicalis TaxID=1561998 RepID=A0A1I7TC22_9PELO